MPNCEICGQDSELLSAEIESMDMSVCSNCAKFGRVKEKPQIKTRVVENIIRRSTRPESRLEMTESIVSDYAQKIRKTRERLGLKQEDFAQKINEKESLLHKMETSSFEPSIPLARKLEKILGIKLVEKVEEKKLILPKSSSEGITIGDMIKRK